MKRAPPVFGKTNITPGHQASIVHAAAVAANDSICREHYRLTLRVRNFPPAYAGQFVHLCPLGDAAVPYSVRSTCRENPTPRWSQVCAAPLLRRAFSIAGLDRDGDTVTLSVIYRVVGRATRWMASLRAAEQVSMMGPLGNAFPIEPAKHVAWLVSGGVGLPPMLWLAEALHKTGCDSVAFCGARTAELLPLTLNSVPAPADDARRAATSCQEFARHDTPVVISTDDGSLGYRGHIGEALATYHEANPCPADRLVVYTCGPEPMMRFVARYCLARAIACYACMERSMACGTGLCQSCVVPVHDDEDSEGWRYRLCCREGPIFDAADLLWETPVSNGTRRAGKMPR